MTVQIDTTAENDGLRLRQQGGDPAAPSASHWILYAKAGGIYVEDDASSVTGPLGTGGGGAWGTATLLNDSGGGVVAGDLVFIVDYGTASAFTTYSGLPNQTSFIPGIVEDASIASGASGLVRFFGVAPVSNLDASATQGDRIATSTTVKQASPHTIFYDYDAGDFGVALDTGTTPPVFLWGFPVQHNERLLASVPSVNLNTATAQLLYTVPAGRTAIITRVVVRLASTSLTTWSGSFGFNSTSFNDVIADATHTELTGNTLYTALVPKVGAAIGTATSGFNLKNNTLQGAPASATIDVIGYLY